MQTKKCKDCGSEMAYEETEISGVIQSSGDVIFVGSSCSPRKQKECCFRCSNPECGLIERI